MLQCSSRCHWGQQLVPASSFLPLQHCRRGIDSRRNGQWPSGMMHEDYSHLYRDLIQHRHSGVLRDRDKWMRKGHVAYGTCFLPWPQQLRGRKELGKEGAMAFNNNINQEFLCQLPFLNNSVMKLSLVRFWDQPALQYVYCNTYCLVAWQHLMCNGRKSTINVVYTTYALY